MDNESKAMNEARISELYEKLSKLEEGTEDHKGVVDELTQLYKIKLEEDRVSIDKRDRIIGRVIDCAAIGVPLCVYVGCYILGLKFEESGTITSKWASGVIQRLTPRK